MRLTEVRQTLPSTVFIVAWLSTFVVSSYARGLIAQTPGVLDSAQLAAIWKSVYYPIFDSVVVSAGLSRLRSSVLPEGRREVRIWVGGGFTAPEDLYRFVDDHGQVSGELVRHWGVLPVDSSDRSGEPEDLVLYSLRGSCSRYSTSARKHTCRAEFTRSPDWGAVLKRAEAAGLWTLPDESSLPSDGMQILDGWSITVELRDGSRYRAYNYNNPDIRKRWPEPGAPWRSARRSARSTR